MKKASAGTQAAYPVSGVGNALQLLQLLEERNSLKLSDVSAELGIAASTAHRLLAMFRQCGFVEQAERGRAYRVGPGLLAFSARLSARQLLLVRIRPLLEALAARANETVHIATLGGALVTYVDCVEARRSERATPRTGRTMPSYATAAGKALLAELGADELDALFPSAVLQPLTAQTLATRDELRTDLDRTRRRGFAANEGESQLGYFACGAVFASGTERAAVVVAAPSRRFRRHRYVLAEELCTAAREIDVVLAPRR